MKDGLIQTQCANGWGLVLVFDEGVPVKRNVNLHQLWSILTLLGAQWPCDGRSRYVRWVHIVQRGPGVLEEWLHSRPCLRRWFSERIQSGLQKTVRPLTQRFKLTLISICVSVCWMWIVWLAIVHWSWHISIGYRLRTENLGQVISDFSVPYLGSLSGTRIHSVGCLCFVCKQEKKEKKKRKEDWCPRL